MRVLCWPRVAQLVGFQRTRAHRLLCLVCYIRTGSIFLAQTQDRLISLKRINSRLNVIGIPSEIISLKRVAELHPLLNMHDLVGAMHVPEDAVVSSADVALALASAASQNGVQIYDRTSILHVMVKKGQVTGVETDKGQIECQYFVNCAGQDAGIGDSGDREVGELPRDLHPRHEVHHGRVSFGTGLLRPGGMNSAGLSFGGGAGKY
ncbi:pyruvate dehydrogenase phosphatase regulatory subunit, mitochondrial-like isoform X2 [Rousettus aegyptiacus]|uniref:pyruvate dehydrogenase phosphatase regulatory subunit, mitochondrial-like isoform X2 n=1 Tax=Rousettus aegyptiacus TaxID=9407 RepID=UPI00168CC121|nr:pyruvate dehydrogenase phosphatase regulatory subunit, mitochondrial-like isoform X2 [Rousettus aegyptiacus]